MSDVRTRRMIWVVILIGIVGAGAYFWRHENNKAEASSAAEKKSQAPRGISVLAAEAKTGDLPVYLTGLGNVSAFNTVTVRSRVEGQLIKVAFTEGQTVKEGDLLAEIDSRPYQVQLSQMQGQLARDEALLNNARADLKRNEDAREALPQQQIDTAISTVAQYEGAVRVDQAQIDNAKLLLEYCKITAPLSGRIGLRLVDQGNMVHVNDLNGLAVITQLQPIAIQFSLPQDELPKILKAQANGNLIAEAYDRDLKNRIAAGELLAIDNQIDATTGTIRLKAGFKNEDNSLFPNQFVNVRLLIDTKRNAILVPPAAIQRGTQGTFVYVVKSDETIEVKPVKIGVTEGENTVVLEGLAAGETVVTDGADKLQSGSKVTVRKGAK